MCLCIFHQRLTNLDDGWNNSDSRRNQISHLIWNIFHCTELNFSYPWQGIHKFQWTFCTIHLLPPANEVVGRWCFHRCVSVHRGVSTHPPWTWHLPHMVSKWAVRILLECFLVQWCCAKQVRDWFASENVTLYWNFFKFLNFFEDPVFTKKSKFSKFWLKLIIW